MVAREAPSLTPRISVVVPSYRRIALLDRCLSALVAQDLPGSQFEIIVVHDGPSEACRRLAQQWRRRIGPQKGPGFAFHEQSHRGPAAARNVGWRAACAEIVAFTDDDTEPDSRWLSSALEGFAADADAAWGRILVPTSSNPTDYELDAARLEHSQFATANCFCRRRVLEAVGGFDERFELAWREDTDLLFRLLGAGAKVVRLPRAIVVHPVRRARWGVSITQQRKVSFDALLFKKHPRLYRERIRRSPRWDYYATVVVLVGTGLGWAAGAVEAALVGGTAWGLLTLRFCLVRLRPASKRLSHVAEMALTSALIPPIAVFWRIVGALKFRVVFL